MSSKSRSNRARAYMRDNPGTKYQQALDLITNRAISNADQVWLRALGLDELSPRAITELWESTDLTTNLDVPIGALTKGVVDLGNVNTAAIHGTTGTGKAVLAYSPLGGEKIKAGLVPTLRGDSAEMEGVEFIDLVDDIRYGNGPNGVIQGITGSGKSFLLNNTLLGLCIGHSPNKLNLMLVDFKGGYTFRAFNELPHTQVVLNNVDWSPHLFTRLVNVINYEMQRRKEILDTVGSKDIYEYRMAMFVPTLPHLVIALDEAREFFYEHREMAEQLLPRVSDEGARLGLHLVYSSQLVGSETLDLIRGTGFRISLRASKLCSVNVVGVPMAYDLPLGKGDAILHKSVNGADQLSTFRGFSIEPISGQMTDALLGTNTAIPHHIWPPSLDTPITLRDRNLSWLTGVRNDSDLTIRIGTMDLPSEGCQKPFTVSLKKNVLVTGRKTSGKTTALAMAKLSALVTYGDKVDWHGFAYPAQESELVNLVDTLSASPATGPAVVQVIGIDDMETMSFDNPDTVSKLATLIRERDDVALVATTPSRTWLSSEILESIGTVIQLEPNPTSAESEWSDSRRDHLVPDQHPGWGVTEDGTQFRITVPATVSHGTYDTGGWREEPNQYTDYQKDIDALSEFVTSSGKLPRSVPWIIRVYDALHEELSRRGAFTATSTSTENDDDVEFLDGGLWSKCNLPVYPLIENSATAASKYPERVLAVGIQGMLPVTVPIYKLSTVVLQSCTEDIIHTFVGQFIRAGFETVATTPDRSDDLSSLSKKHPHVSIRLDFEDTLDKVLKMIADREKENGTLTPFLLIVKGASQTMFPVAEQLGNKMREIISRGLNVRVHLLCIENGWERYLTENIGMHPYVEFEVSGNNTFLLHHSLTDEGVHCERIYPLLPFKGNKTTKSWLSKWLADEKKMKPIYEKWV